MAGVDLGSIVAHLKLEMNDFNSKLNEAVAKVKDTQTQFEGLKSFGQSLSSVGAGLTASITAPVMALGASVVQTQMKFQDSMAKVKALSGATGKDFQMLEDTAKKFGESTVFSASECADALGYMALAGWDAQQSADGLPGVLNLAAASGMDLAQASDLVTKSNWSVMKKFIA
jgi:phage-related minor tail protein